VGDFQNPSHLLVVAKRYARFLKSNISGIVNGHKFKFPKMKKSIYWLLLLFAVFVSDNAYGQDEVPTKLEYEIHKIYPFISITKGELLAAEKLEDLHKRYKSEWIKEYFSVEIFALKNGKEQSAFGKNNVLTKEQKALMASADTGTEIKVKVNYLPENNLKQNEPKLMEFEFSVLPEFAAQFPEEEINLKKYLKETAIDKMGKTVLKGYEMAAYIFTINESGEAVDPKIDWSSKDAGTDELMISTICNMPNWNPAQYDNGLKVKQEMVLLVGNMESCVAHLFTIRNQGRK